MNGLVSDMFASAAGLRSRIAAIASKARFTATVLASLAAASASILAAPAGAAAQSVTPTTPVTAGSRYLALGDSVTFGYKESGVVPAPNYHDAASFVPYPELLGAEMHLNVANSACPGETSSSLINPSAPSLGCENLNGQPGSGYRTLYPLHVSYKGSQLAYALGYLRRYRNVRLVSLMIGANDGFLCQQYTPDHCLSASELNTFTSTVSKNVKTILSAIRNTARYHGQLAIVNYYSIDYASPLESGESGLLNKAVDTSAKPFHVEIADGYGEFQTATTDWGGDTCAAGLLTYLPATKMCGVHPSYAGQSLLAQALEKAIIL